MSISVMSPLFGKRVASALPKLVNRECQSDIKVPAGGIPKSPVAKEERKAKVVKNASVILYVMPAVFL